MKPKLRKIISLLTATRAHLWRWLTGQFALRPYAVVLGGLLTAGVLIMAGVFTWAQFSCASLTNCGFGPPLVMATVLAVSYLWVAFWTAVLAEGPLLKIVQAHREGRTRRILRSRPISGLVVVVAASGLMLWTLMDCAYFSTCRDEGVFLVVVGGVLLVGCAELTYLFWCSRKESTGFWTSAC